jgi:hypothetical protein
MSQSVQFSGVYKVALSEFYFPKKRNAKNGQKIKK